MVPTAFSTIPSFLPDDEEAEVPVQSAGDGAEDHGAGGVQDNVDGVCQLHPCLL